MDYRKTIVCPSILSPSLGPTGLGGKRGKRWIDKWLRAVWTPSKHLYGQTATWPISWLSCDVAS
jgi:hypothetical protein